MIIFVKTSTIFNILLILLLWNISTKFAKTDDQTKPFTTATMVFFIVRPCRLNLTVSTDHSDTIGEYSSIYTWSDYPS